MSIQTSNRELRRRAEREAGKRLLQNQFRKPSRGFGITVTNNIIAMLIWNKSIILWERKTA